MQPIIQAIKLRHRPRSSAQTTNLYFLECSPSFASRTTSSCWKPYFSGRCTLIHLVYNESI
ncbi:hypothetical protein B0H10DRAFT_2054695 [Mycena sp. CBHHK59/15]|nr:hypothetical protein B0H10DRAFT_2054695 [Mycena sp. CBHHK59/15]